MTALGLPRQTVPAGLERFTYWLPEDPIPDDPRLPWWIRQLAGGEQLPRGPSKLLPGPDSAAAL
jgi:hypothetical protein